MNWSRSDVELGGVWELDGLLYKVVGLIDEPVAIMQPLDERDGEEREYHVISSPNFAGFRKVEAVRADGDRTEMEASDEGVASEWRERRRWLRREHLAVRVSNILGRQGLTVASVKSWDDDRLLAIPDIGPKAVEVIRDLAATCPPES